MVLSHLFTVSTPPSQRCAAEGCHHSRTRDQAAPDWRSHGSLNVPIEHHPTIRYMVYNGYYKVMSNIPKMGQLPTPGSESLRLP